MANIQNKQELIARNASRIVKSTSNFEIAQTAFSVDLDEKLTDRGRASATAFEMLTGRADEDEWKKAFLMNDILKEMQKLDEKAKAGDLAKFFNGGKTNFYNYMKCGAEVVFNAETKTIETPKDIHGGSFTLSNYALIISRKKEISEGYFLATMTQKELQEKIKLLNSAIKEAETVETTEATEIYDEEIEEPKLKTEETLEVHFNGEIVELTPEQVKAILEIIGK